MMHPCQYYKYSATEIEVLKNSEEYFAEHLKVSDLEKDKVHWINFHSTLKKSEIEKLCDNFGIEQLSSDEIFVVKRRPKLEEFDHYLFFSIRSALPGTSERTLLYKEQLSFVMGRNYLLSFQERSSDHFTDVRARIENKRGRIRDRSVDYTLCRLLDAIVENYFEVLDDISDSIQKLDKMLISNAHSATLKEIELEKRKLIDLRKVALPLKEIVIQLESSGNEMIRKENRFFFKKLKENCTSVLEEIDANKQILEGMANLFYAIQGQRMNEIMKLLTVISVIFIPLSFLAGLYGMNFKHMPELEMKYAYPIVLLVMFTVAVGMITFFLRKGWIKRKSKR